MRNIILTVIVFISVTMVCFSQTEDRAVKVITFDKREYSGKVISEDSQQIVIEDIGIQVTILKSQIATIKYFSSVKQLNELKEVFSFLGASLIMPGGLNIVVGHEHGRFGGRLSVGYIGSMGGIQGNFLVNLSRRKSFNHHLSIGFGSTYIDTKEYVQYWGEITTSKTWTYVGGFYDLNYGGFFLETGLSIGSGDFSNPQLMLQLGYVYEFR